MGSDSDEYMPSPAKPGNVDHLPDGHKGISREAAKDLTGMHQSQFTDEELVIVEDTEGEVDSEVRRCFWTSRCCLPVTGYPLM